MRNEQLIRSCLFMLAISMSIMPIRAQENGFTLKEAVDYNASMTHLLSSFLSLITLSLM